MRFAPALALVVVIAAMPPAARAADVRAAFTVSRDRPAVAPRTANHDDRRRQERTIVIVPQIVFVSPGRCWQSGYWSYQWVAQSYSYNTWVPGVWSPDGYWIAAHYEPGWYDGGYYQPLWVEGYWAGC